MFAVEISSLRQRSSLGREVILHHRSFPSPVTPDDTYNLEALAEELKLTKFLLRRNRGADLDGSQATDPWRTVNLVCLPFQSVYGDGKGSGD